MTRCNQNLGGFIAGVIVITLCFLLVVAPAKAATPEPTTVALTDIEVFNGLLVTDDFLAVVPYEISMPSTPDERIDEAYIFRLLSANGTTELGSVTANPYNNGGWGSGVVSFYVESGMVSGTAYIFRVQQNPTYYPSPDYWDFPITSGDYSSGSDQQDALKAKIIETSTLLSVEYGQDLLTRSETGIRVLSPYGELYYLEAIPGLQTMAPDLFEVQLESPDFTRRTWSTTFADALRTTYSGTFIYDFMTGFAGLFSIETSPAMNFLSTILFLVVVSISVLKFKASTLSAMLDGYTFALLLMLTGFFSMIWAGFVAFCTAVVGGAILFFKRS